MCKILVKTKNLTHNEWLKYRQLGIGGSDAGAIMGANKYRSAIDVYIDKTSDVPSAIEDNEAMRLGRDLEDYCSKRFTEATGLAVHRSNVIYQSTENPFMLANIDRKVSGQNIGLEIKTVSPLNESLWDNNEIPSNYYYQIMHYMAVTGFEAFYICALIFGKRLVIHKIERNEDVIHNLISKEKSFWYDYVQAGIMPLSDGSKSAKTAISNYYATATPNTDIPLIDYDEELNRWDEITSQQEMLATEKNIIEDHIKQVLKDAEAGNATNHKITWKNVVSNRFDSYSLKKDLPEIYERYLKTNTHRRFMIKPA